MFPNLSAAKEIAIDIETYDPELKEKGPGVRRTGYIVGLAVGVTEKQWYFPFAHDGGDNLSKEEVFRWAKTELCRPNQPKIGANIIYDLDYLYHAGIEVEGPFHDIQIAEPLIDENRASYSLNALSLDYCGEGKTDDEMIKWIEEHVPGGKHNPHAHIWRTPGNLCAKYAKGDVRLPLEIFAKQKKLLQKDGLENVFQLETALIPLLLFMRQKGVRIDVEAAEQLKKTSERKIKKHKKSLKGHVGFDVEVWASSSLEQAFAEVGLAHLIPRTAKSASFQKTWLERHAHHHPMIDDIIEIRRLDKFVGTFIQGSILDMLIGDRIHTQFHQLRSERYGTVSGRFSSSQPNLQFIPARDEELGPLCRGLFIPEGPEWLWGKFDYSQIEPRLLLHYANDKIALDLKQRYRDDPRLDCYEAMRSYCGDLIRQDIKTIFLGMSYGLGKANLAKKLGKGQAQAEKIFAAFHAGAPYVNKLKYDTMNAAAKRGWVRTILGRRARFPYFEPKDNWDYPRKPALLYLEAVEVYGKDIKRAFAYKALNRIIQGGAADVMKQAMRKLWESGLFQNGHAYPHLTVHDEMDVSLPCDPNVGPTIARQISEIMEQCLEDIKPLTVPLVVDGDFGPNWGSCKLTEQEAWAL